MAIGDNEEMDALYRERRLLASLIEENGGKITDEGLNYVLNSADIVYDCARGRFEIKLTKLT